MLGKYKKEIKIGVIGAIVSAVLIGSFSYKMDNMRLKLQKNISDDFDVKFKELQKTLSAEQAIRRELVLHLNKNGIEMPTNFIVEKGSSDEKLNPSEQKDSIFSIQKYNTRIAMQRDCTYVELEKQYVFNDSLVVQNTLLADIVEKASVLNLSKFSVDAIREHNSGNLVSTSRAKFTDKFKICFTVADNVIADAGDREFFIDVLDSQGNLIGESYLKTTNDGVSVKYSKRINFYYDNESLDVCDYINKPSSNFQKGNYMVNVYDDRLKLLGTSKFALK